MNEETQVSRRYGKRMIAVAWIAVLAILFLFFDERIARFYNPNPAPISKLLEDGGTRIVLLRNRYGHYVATGGINGQPVNFLVDTGASDVNIPKKVADKLNLIRGEPFYARTANGTVTVYRTHLDTVELGGIRFENIKGSINPHMEGDSILLGMEFLKRLDFNQTGRELTLTAPAR